MLSRPLMTTQEVAEVLNIKEATVRKWIRDGELPAIQFHREWRVAVRHLEEFVAARVKPAGKQSPASTRRVTGNKNRKRRAATPGRSRG
jgi:excisionase family DNA binding protein